MGRRAGWKRNKGEARGLITPERWSVVKALVDKEHPIQTTTTANTGEISVVKVEWQ